MKRSCLQERDVCVLFLFFKQIHWLDSTVAGVGPNIYSIILIFLLVNVISKIFLSRCLV